MSRDKHPPARLPVAEDEALWHRAMKETRPLKGRLKSPAGARPPVSPAPPDYDRPSATMAGSPKRAASGALPGRDIDRRNHRRLRRGEMPIEARLDLHGCTLARAHRLLDDFLSGAHRRGLRCVLVITGKGGGAKRASIDAPFMRRAAGGVLRRHLPDWLNEGENRRRVLTLEPAQRRDGGSGAFYVLLRRRRR